MGTFENSRFAKTMSALGYVLEEQVGKKLQYKKRTQFADLVLIIDLEGKYINPILVPTSLILYERETVLIYHEFKEMRKHAKIISDMSDGRFQVLNKPAGKEENSI